MKIIALKQHPEYKERAISYFQSSWPNISPLTQQNIIEKSIAASQLLPQWYLLELNGELIGCAGLISNELIFRKDLYPWLYAIFIDEKQRGHAYGALLIQKAKQDAKLAGYDYLKLSTPLIGYYEKYGFHYIGEGEHPWEEGSRIYQAKVE